MTGAPSKEADVSATLFSETEHPSLQRNEKLSDELQRIFISTGIFLHPVKTFSGIYTEDGFSGI